MCRFRQLILISTVLQVGACGSPQANAGSGDLGNRRWVTGAWDTVLTIGQGPEDTTLLFPYAVELWADYLIITDDVDQTVAASDHRTGERAWKLERHGGGPEEFGWIRDVQEGTNGNLWVLDGKNMRISELSRRGELVRILPLRDLPTFPWSFIDLGDSIVVGIRDRNFNRPFRSTARSGQLPGAGGAWRRR